MTAINLIHRALRRAFAATFSVYMRFVTAPIHAANNAIHRENIIKEQHRNSDVVFYFWGGCLHHSIKRNQFIDACKDANLYTYIYIFSITSIQPENYNKQFSPFDIGGAGGGARTGIESIYTLLGIRLINLCSLTYYNFFVCFLCRRNRSKVPPS